MTTPFEGRRAVQKAEETVIAANVKGGNYLRWPRQFNTMTFQVEPSPKRTRGRTPSRDIAVAFAGRLQSPYVAQNISRQEPRPDSPQDITSYVTSVLVDLECAALIDRTANRVLAPIEVNQVGAGAN